MYAEPKIDRINEMMERKTQILKLIDSRWDDKSIANFLASDHRTIRRFRKAYEKYGKAITPEQVLTTTY